PCNPFLLPRENLIPCASFLSPPFTSPRNLTTMGRSMPLSCWSFSFVWVLWALRSGGCRFAPPGIGWLPPLRPQLPLRRTMRLRRLRPLPPQSRPAHPANQLRRTTVRHLNPHPLALNRREAVLIW